MRKFHHATWVYGDRRWPALRLAAKRRDGWKCVKCGSKVRLEVDHIQRVRDRPDLAFVLGNLQTLCASCHTRKTQQELGQAPNPERVRWLRAVRALR